MPSTRVKPKAKPQRSATRPPPGVFYLGGEPVILPEGRMTRGAFSEFALAVLVEPTPRLLPEWLRRLEASLGVKDEHRVALEERAIRAAEEAEAHDRRTLEQAIRASELSGDLRDPEHVRRIAKTQAALARARAIAENPPGKSDREKRKAARVARANETQLLQQLREQSIAEVDEWRLHGDAHETILMAKARGDDVTAYEAQTAEFAVDEHGARILERVRGHGIGAQTYLRPVMNYGTGLRARKLTGIEHAKDAGYLGKSWREAERLHKIGVDYREAYIVVEGAAGRSGEGGGGRGPKAPQPRQIELGQDLADMRRGLNLRQREVLDLVCGQDMRLRDATAQLRLGDPRTTERALVTGLAAASESLIDQREHRIASGQAHTLGAMVSAANHLLARVRL